MKYIKVFEIFDIREENTKADIYGIFVELVDLGYEIEVDIDRSVTGDQIYISITKDYFGDDLEKIGEYTEMLEDYLKEYLNNYEVIYKAGYSFVSYDDNNLAYRYMGNTYNEFMKRMYKNDFSKSLKSIRILVLEQ